MPLKLVSTTLSGPAAIAQERRRISRDLHDGTIQPYIGLKLGLEALRRRLEGANPLAREVDELIEVAGEGIAELRRYVSGLKDERRRRRSTESIVQGLRCQARRFSDLSGVRTEVRAGSEILVPASLRHEVTQIVREALSNIRRHTAATRAAIVLRIEGDALMLEVENDRGGFATPVFRPRSIDERVQDLGGRVRVARRPEGRTTVTIEIPLERPWPAS